MLTTFQGFVLAVTRLRVVQLSFTHVNLSQTCQFNALQVLLIYLLCKFASH